MTTEEWLQTARVGGRITINRGESEISGAVTGVRVDTQQIDVSTAGRTAFLPGRSTTFVMLDPWRIEIELRPSDTILDSQ